MDVSIVDFDVGVRHPERLHGLSKQLVVGARDPVELPQAATGVVVHRRALELREHGGRAPQRRQIRNHDVVGDGEVDSLIQGRRGEPLNRHQLLQRRKTSNIRSNRGRLENLEPDVAQSIIP